MVFLKTPPCPGNSPGKIRAKEKNENNNYVIAWECGLEIV